MNGLDIAYLNGVGDTNRFFLNGFNKQIENEINFVGEGQDFAGVDWENPLAVEEATRSHLERSYKLAEKYPQIISGYQNPTEYKKMLGYVLANWDTEQREQAIKAMAKEEERLIGIGAIKIDDEQEAFYLEGDNDIFTADELEPAQLGAVSLKTTKRGTFNALQKLTNPYLTGDERDVVINNPFLAKYKRKLRKNIAQNRRKVAKNVQLNSGEYVVMQQNKATNSTLQGLGATLDNNEDLLAVLYGYDLEEVGTTGDRNADRQAYRNYLIRTHKVVSQKPTDFFDSEAEAKTALGVLGSIIVNSANLDNFENAIDGTMAGLQGLGDLGVGFIFRFCVYYIPYKAFDNFLR